MKRLVLRTPTTCDQLLDHFDAKDWFYVREHQPVDGDDRPQQIGWVRGSKDQHRIHWFDDRTLGLQFFEITSKEAALRGDGGRRSRR